MAKLRLAPSLRHGQRSAAVARLRRTSRRVSLAGRIRTYTEEAPPGPVDSPTGYLAADRSPGFARGWEPRLKNEALCTYKISHRLPTCSRYPPQSSARTRFTIEPDRERQRRSAYSRDLIDQCTATILSNCRSRANFGDDGGARQASGRRIGAARRPSSKSPILHSEHWNCRCASSIADLMPIEGACMRCFSGKPPHPEV